MTNDERFFFGQNAGSDSYSEYQNPFFGIPLQWLPRNIDDMSRWANHFLFRFPFYRSALSRIANYFITNIVIECENEQDKKVYEETFEVINWKAVLAEAGLNLLASGNVFLSINQFFTKNLCCINCQTTVNLDSEKIDFKFETGKYKSFCAKCKCETTHTPIDAASKDLSKLNIVSYPTEEIHIRMDSASKASEYFWEIPKQYLAQIKKKKNKFYAKHTPKVILEAAFKSKNPVIKLKDTTFIHLKIPTPTSLETGGKAIPYCIYMFDAFFMLKVLERYNEVISFEDINPFRVFAMSDGAQSTNTINPLTSQNADKWMAGIDEMVTRRRQDPGSYHKFPFPLYYTQLGAEGKTLAPVELIEYATASILNGLNIPQELYKMNLTIQAAGPALRLFENSWAVIPFNYNKLLQKIADVISAVKGITEAKVSILATTMVDDMERKSAIMNLVSANAISREELLGLYNLNYKDQLLKKQKEQDIEKELQEEQQKKEMISETFESSMFGNQSGQGGGGGTPGDVLQEAQEIAQQLIGQDPATIRSELQKIKATNETMYHQVKGMLDELRSSHRSQGLQQGKSQQQ